MLVVQTLIAGEMAAMPEDLPRVRIVEFSSICACCTGKRSIGSTSFANAMARPLRNGRAARATGYISEEIWRPEIASLRRGIGPGRANTQCQNMGRASTDYRSKPRTQAVSVFSQAIKNEKDNVAVLESADAESESVNET